MYMTFLRGTSYSWEWYRLCSHRKSGHQMQLRCTLAMTPESIDTDTFENYAHLYCRQSSRYLSCFLIHSSLWISRITFQSAVGLLPSVRPLKRDTTATSQPYLWVRMVGNSANLDSVSWFSILWHKSIDIIRNYYSLSPFLESHDWKPQWHFLQPSSSVAR